jgi:hypothetical protein
MAQTGSTIPCPCGSGRPIKDCCFADSLNAMKNEFLSRALNQDTPLTKDTITQIAREIAKKQQAYNARPIDDFDGLSPEAMSQLLNYPFESTGVVRINPNPKGFTNAPVYRLFTLLVKEMQEAGIKATAKGNLGRNACRHIAEQYFTEAEYKEVTKYCAINMEEDFMELSVLRYVSSTAGLIRKYKGMFILTKKCQKLLSEGKDAAIYRELFRTYCDKFNWSYGDGCYDHPFFQRSFMFTLHLLQKFGGEKRDTDFYGEKFIRAFPKLKQEILANSRPFEMSREDYYIMHCLRLRVIERFTQFFGLVEIEAVGEDRFERKHMVMKTPLLDEMFEFTR